MIHESQHKARASSPPGLRQIALIGRPDDTRFRDDGSNQLVGRYIECRTVHLAILRGRAPAKTLSHFLCRSFLDRDILAGTNREVDRRHRRGNVKGNAMVTGIDRE